MAKVSVVVPCLNMRQYIGACLESITAQTLKDIEILVVDAGSSDGTLEILDGLMKKDKRISLVCSSQKSYGHQVNLGIRHAAGRYIAIVDADDKITPGMYETLYGNAVRSGADYVKGTAKSFYTISDDFTYYMPLGQFSGAEYRNGIIEVVPAGMPELLTRDNFLWYGIFRREFMKDILLHESPGAAFQDLGGLLQTQMQARKAVYLKDAFYEYRQDNAAASARNPHGFRFVWEEYTWAERFITGACDGWKAAFYRKLFLHTMSVYSTMAAGGTFWEGSREYIRLIAGRLRERLTDGLLCRESFSGEEWDKLRMFMENDGGLYDIFAEQHSCRRRQLINISKTAENRNIVIFGYGNLGIFVYAQIKRHGLGRVAAFCDNQREKQGLLFDGIAVLSPEQAAERYCNGCFVVAGGRWSGDMSEQLTALGVPRKQICAYTAGMEMRLFGMSPV